MSAPTNRLAALAAVLAAAAPAAAQPPDPASPGEAETARRYRVEVILFTHRDVDGFEERLGTAAPLPPSGIPARRQPFGIEPGVGDFGEPAFSDRPARRPQDRTESGANDAPSPAGPDSNGPGGDRSAPAADPDAGESDRADQLELLGPPSFQARTAARRFEPLEPEALTLNATRRRLENVDAYRVLAHAGWEQPGLPQNEAQPVDLAELGISNPTGTLTMYVSRYVHVLADLRYRTDEVPAPRPNAPQGPSSPAPESEAGGLGPGAAGPRARPDEPSGITGIRTEPVYVLEARRRARTGELHYIDHPLLGVLVLVTEAPEEPEGNEPADGELAPAA